MRQFNVFLLGWKVEFHLDRSMDGVQVDLILERDGILHPMEIKMTSQASRNDIRGISAFKNIYPNAKIAAGAVVCCSSHAYKITEDLYALPWNQKW